MTIPPPPNWIMLVVAAGFFIAWAFSARGENCLTNNNTGTATTVTGTAGSFFQIGGSDVVRFPNPPGISNAQGITANASTNSIGTSATGLSCGTNAKAGGPLTVAIGRGAQANGTNSVALGSGSVADRPNTVSVGTLTDPRTVSNVAAGQFPNDAVNAAQLATVGGALQSQINNQQMQITGVRNEVTTLRKQTFAGISMAMAAAALQTGAGASGPGKVALGLGGGEFGGTASLSAGIAYSPTKRLNFNAGVSVAPIVGMFGVFGGTTYTLN